MKTIAVCVGHARIGDTGAQSYLGYTERAYNGRVAQHFASYLQRRGFSPVVFDHYPHRSYGDAMRWLCQQIKAAECDLAVELHFNSAESPKANGSEFLYWHTSTASKRAATNFDAQFAAAFPNITRRGLLPRGPADNGAAFLRGTHCPAVILEPFFGSNKEEALFFRAKQPELGLTYANAVEHYFAS